MVIDGAVLVAYGPVSHCLEGGPRDPYGREKMPFAAKNDATRTRLKPSAASRHVDESIDDNHYDDGGNPDVDTDADRSIALTHAKPSSS
jgi:hypothetical protein